MNKRTNFYILIHAIRNKETFYENFFWLNTKTGNKFFSDKYM